jgi:hypothetical protein
LKIIHLLTDFAAYPFVKNANIIGYLTIVTGATFILLVGDGFFHTIRKLQSKINKGS